MKLIESQTFDQLIIPAVIGVGALAVTTYLWFFSGKKRTPVQCATDPKNQSIPIKYEDSKHVRANPQFVDEPINYMERETQTLHDVFLRGLRESQNGPCFGWRPGPQQPYQWLTYQEVLDSVKQFGSGLISIGAQTNPEQFIGVFSQNRVDWKIAEQACNSFSMVIVPLYDTLGTESIEHIIKQCNLKIIVVDKMEKVKALMKGIEQGTYTLDYVISMDEPTQELLSLANQHSVKLQSMNSIKQLGSKNLQDFVPPKPTDLHTICYTSGTTGLPKGVMLTHRNIVADIAGVYAIGQKSFFKIDRRDVHISYLPLAHIFERLMQCQMLYSGGSVGFFQGDVKLLLSDVAALRPTVFPMVPRVINRFYDKITTGAAASCFKSLLLGKALNAKLDLLRQGVVTRDSIWDKLVFKKIQNMMGGRLRICITGAAPISMDVLNFMRCALGVYFTEGYGQTESSAAISISIPGDYDSGSVGTPALCNVVKLVDVPEQNYYADQGKGEVCAKGSNIFIGYYKNQEKTDEALDKDGWLHTGDIGTWLPNGSLKIIDRKKNIFKLAQGEYVAPEKIEGILVQSAAVAQVFVYGESLKSSLVAVVVPDRDVFESWCAAKGVKGAYDSLCQNAKVKDFVLNDIHEIGKKRGLLGFELAYRKSYDIFYVAHPKNFITVTKPKKIHLSSELFSVENDLLTPTFKARRPQIYERYQTEITTLYSDLI